MDSDKLALLVSMGFDIDMCEAILQIENLSIEEAVQRLLEAQQRNSTQGNESVSRQVPSNISSEEHHERLGTHRNDLEIPEGNDDVIVSRLALSERQKEIKDEFERKEREEVQSAVRKRKIQDKNAKSFILQEIEANKMRIKQLRSSETRQATEGSDKVEKKIPETAVIEDPKVRLCRIQVRLPSGGAITRQFPEVSLLRDVLGFATDALEERDETVHPILIQPFPRREFIANDLQCSLASLGLFPNASLVLMLQRKTRQTGVCNIVPTTNPVNRTYDGGATNNIHSVHHAPPVPHHEWGDGARLCTTASANESGNAGGSEGDEQRRAHIKQSACLRSLLKDDLRNDEHTNSRGRSSGEGSSLGSAPITTSSSDEAKQRNVTVMEAIRKRTAVQTSSTDRQQKAERDIHIERDIHPLVEVCADCVAKSLAAQHGPVLSFIGRTLSQQAAAQVINALKKRKLLTGKFLQLFHPCKLLQLNLDCYNLTSNEVLEAARLHTTLTCLSLSQCALITDLGLITAVRGLKHLQILDLSGCVQITDKSLFEIKGLRELRSLKLDNTKIKDGGMLDFLSFGDRTNLFELSANATMLSEKAFDIQENGKTFNLTVLSLDRTKVSSLAFLVCFPSLHQLNLSGTPLDNDAIQSLTQMKQLEELNLSYTEVSDHALKCIVGLPLRSLGLPNRLHFTDSALQYIQDLPLTKLNLADYINVTDDGLKSIGKIYSLMSLSLANTKITDDGAHHLAGLSKLQELDLGKTQIGDEAVRTIQGLKSLHTLGLASTRITDEVFKDDTVNAFENLTKLNISRNKVSDAGIFQLRLVFLELINADQTYASEAAALNLIGCPNLKALRARNCRPVSELTEDQQA